MVKKQADLSKLPASWESVRKLRSQSSRGFSVFVSTVEGQTSCRGNKKDCSVNYDALMCILELMLASRTVDTPGVDKLSEVCKDFLEMSNFPDKSAIPVVAHRDAWSAKRCLTFLKRKWARNETPKDRKGCIVHSFFYGFLL